MARIAAFHCLILQVNIWFVIKVFAMGDLLDLTQPWVMSRGLRYYLLARASLCLDPVLESPTVTALQALVLLYQCLPSSAINDL